MGKRVADQHAVMDRGWNVAHDLAAAIQDALGWHAGDTEAQARVLMAGLRRYEEARQS